MIYLPSGGSNQFIQLHGHDRRLRLKPEAALDLQFHHSLTEEDAQILADARADLGNGIQRAGMTEWQAEFSGQLVSLGWDWAMLPTGGIALVMNAGPRSNLQLLDAGGYDLQGHSHDQALWQLICQLAWEDGLAFDLMSPHANAATSQTTH